MPNIASVLKSEISRVARKEVRGETTALKKSVGAYRGEIAALKRRTQALEEAVRRLSKANATVAPVAPDETPSRMSATGVIRPLQSRRNPATRGLAAVKL
jgi:hypothetical protein